MAIGFVIYRFVAQASSESNATEQSHCSRSLCCPFRCTDVEREQNHIASQRSGASAFARSAARLAARASSDSKTTEQRNTAEPLLSLYMLRVWLHMRRTSAFVTLTFHCRTAVATPLLSLALLHVSLHRRRARAKQQSNATQRSFCSRSICCACGCTCVERARLYPYISLYISSFAAPASSESKATEQRDTAKPLPSLALLLVSLHKRRARATQRTFCSPSLCCAFSCTAAAA